MMAMRLTTEVVRFAAERSIPEGTVRLCCSWFAKSSAALAGRLVQDPPLLLLLDAGMFLAALGPKELVSELMFSATCAKRSSNCWSLR